MLPLGLTGFNTLSFLSFNFRLVFTFQNAQSCENEGPFSGRFSNKRIPAGPKYRFLVPSTRGPDLEDLGWALKSA